MPTVSIDIDFALCPICKEQFNEPKALPCLHTFCQNCLQDDINRRQLQSERTLTGFPCPVCRTHTSPPDPGLAVSEWAKCFITNFHITKLMDKTKSEQLLNIGCQPCSRLKRRHLAVSWCVNCQEAMCTECTEAHEVLTVRSSHDIKPLSVLDLKKLSEQVSEDLCHIHSNEVLKLFCERCEEVLCSACYGLRHRKCDRVVSVKDIVRVKKEECWKMKRNLEIKKRETEKIMNDLQKKKEKTVASKESIVRDLRSIRLAMEKMLEVKEKTSVEQVEKLHGEKQNHLDTLLKQGECLLSSVITSIEYLRSSAESKKDTEFLRVYHNIKAAASKLWNSSICNGEKVSSSLSFVPNSNFIYCFRKLQDSSLGEGVLTDSSQDQSLSASLDVQETKHESDDVITKWILTPPIRQSPSKRRQPPTKILEKVGEFSVKIDNDSSCQIDDLLVLKDGSLLVTDWANEKVKKFSVNGEFLDQLMVGSWPCKISSLTEDRVVITLPRTKEISYLCHKVPMKITKMVSEKRYYGIAALHGGFLACSTYSPPQIDILTIRAEIISSISNDVLNQQLLLWPHYLATTRSGDLLISDYCRKCLICVDATNEKLKFVYKCDGESSFSPGGVAVGHDGTIFLTDTRQNKIYKFNEDGELTDLFLSLSTGNYKQMGITVGKAGTLFVSEEAPSDSVKAYHV